jgi:hypothetical protein
MPLRFSFTRLPCALALVAVIALLATSAALAVDIPPIIPGGDVGGSGAPFIKQDVLLPMLRSQSNDALGVAFERIPIAHGVITNYTIQAIWLNSDTAKKNDVLGIGFYYPIHMGPCTKDDAKTVPKVKGDDNEDDVKHAAAYNFLTVVDNGVVFCTALDRSASGDSDALGKTVLTQQKITGSLTTGASDATAANPCGATGTTWCQPVGVPLAEGADSVAYVGVLTKKAKDQLPPGKKNTDPLQLLILVAGT